MARPKAFDETEALDAAVACFWQHGYEATSVRDLTKAMGIAGPSLYNAFGDKRGLFARALEQYCRSQTYERIARIEQSTEAQARVGAFLTMVVERSVDDPQRRGCFLINSAIEVAPHDPELGAVITAHLGHVRAFFRRSLVEAQTSRRIRADIDCAQSADHLMAVLLGIRVLARTSPEPAVLEGIVEATLAPLGLTNATRPAGKARKQRPSPIGESRH